MTAAAAGSSATTSFALYKYIRPILQEGSAVIPILVDGDNVSTDKPVTKYPDGDWSGWDAIEHVLPRTGEAVVLAFGSPEGPGTILVKPVGLRAEASSSSRGPQRGAMF